MNYSRIRPLMSRILVKKLKPPKNVSKAGLIIPSDKNAKYGVVLEVSEGYKNEEGKLIKPSLQKGQFVQLPEYGGNNVSKQNPQDDEILVYHESDIIGVVKGVEDLDQKH